MQNSERFNIGITGVGGGVGQSIIKSLQNTDYRLVGFDSEPLATGLYAVSAGHIVPYARDERYIPLLLELCKKEGINVLFPGQDAELAKLSANRQFFLENGINIIVSRPEVVVISDNKAKTFEFCRKHGIGVPETQWLPDFLQTRTGIDFPMILKPAEGARSVGVYKVSTEEEFEKTLSFLIPDPEKYIVQQFIDGDEYTVGSVTLENDLVGIIPMRRTLRNGDTNKCFVDQNPLVTNEVEKLLKAVKPFGACNVQVRVMNDKAYIIEINARCSGTTAARSLAGFNEPMMIIDFLLKDQVPQFEIREISILRYWKELVADNQTIEAVKSAGSISHSQHSQL